MCGGCANIASRILKCDTSWGELSASRSGPFLPQLLLTLWMGRWVYLKAVLDALTNWTHTSAVQPAADHRLSWQKRSQDLANDIVSDTIYSAKILVFPSVHLSLSSQLYPFLVADFTHSPHGPLFSYGIRRARSFVL